MKLAFSIAEFIAIHGLDSELYHELLANGIAPKTYHIKDREFVTTGISIELAPENGAASGRASP